MNTEKPLTYRVRNWANFQHYKDRSPPWIKLHWDLLSSEDWIMLDDNSRLLAVVCMLLASRSDEKGTFSANPEFAKRVAYLNQLPNYKPLIDCGFLEVASTTLAPASESKQTVLRGEERRDRAEQSRGDTTASNESDMHFQQAWTDYPGRSGGNPRGRALKAWNARVKAGVRTTDMLKGLYLYRAWVFATDKDGTEYVMQAATFFGPDEHYLQTWELPNEKPEKESLMDRVRRKNHTDGKTGMVLDTNGRILR